MIQMNSQGIAGPERSISGADATGVDGAVSALGEKGQAAVVAYLASGHAFGGPPPEQIETHAARIFLAGNRAWKLKRAVRYPYLDFSTPEQRRDALRAELTLNRRTAPDLYLGIWPITRIPDGGLQIGEAGEAVDWLLEMERFPQSALFSEMAKSGTLDEDLLVRLADRIFSFHEAAEPILVQDGAERLRRVIKGNLASSILYPSILPQAAVDALISWQLGTLARHSTLLDARGKGGRIRRCHGDLHLANLALIGGEPTLFDCLEFDSELACIDALYDLAFLLMDLWERGQHRQANIVFNRYLDLSAGDESAVGLLPLLMSIRASVRAHVLAATATNPADPSAQRAVAYLALASLPLSPKEPMLVAIGGLSGTGKSSLARALAAEIGNPPGARVVRTDVLRKRIAGVPPESRLPRKSYTPTASRTVYAAAFDLARQAVAHGTSVIIDAVFGDADERATVMSLSETGAPVRALWLTAPLSTRLERIAGRARDASDADEAVARAQTEPAADTLGGWHLLPCGASLADTLSGAKTLLGLP